MLNIDVEKLFEDYLKTQSVHRAAEIHGTSGESARRLMVNSGYKLLRSKWTKKEDGLVLSLSKTKTAKEIGSILGRSKASVDVRISRLNRGLKLPNSPNKIVYCKECRKGFLSFDKNRKYCSINCTTKSDDILKNIRTTGPKKRIFFSEKNCITCGKPFMPTSKSPNKTHCGIKCATRDPEVNKRKIATLRANPFAIKTGYTSCKRGWAKIGGKKIFFRSSWEENYARYLEWLKGLKEIQDWEHEPDTFWFDGIKRGVRSYLPDFKVTTKNGEIEYHEVKGWMDSKSKTKIKRMAKYHPSVKMVIIDTNRYKSLERTVSGLVPKWSIKKPAKKKKR